MVSGKFAGPGRALRSLSERLLRREVRARRWVSQALPEGRVRWHQRQLAQFSRKIEKKFTNLSEGLENLSDESNQLLATSHRLLKYSLGQEDGRLTFASAVAVIERPLAFNDECSAVTNQLEHDLAELAERIGRLHRFRSGLDATIAPLKILQTMFRIESAASSAEVQTLFVSLSSEIERLLVQMSTMIVREFEAIESTGATVNAVISQLREVRSRQLKASMRRNEIANSVRQLEIQLEINQARDVRLIGVTEAIAAKVAGIVGALQYQDIVSQRLGHVDQGLNDIADRVKDIEGAGGDDGLVFLRDVARVESVQLEAVEDIMDGAIGKLSVSLNGLADDMDGLDSECVLLTGVESSNAACDGMIQVLLDTFGENLELIQTTSEQCREICELLEPIRGMLGNLTGSILQLSARIRLIALNAQVQAVQAGEGTGLEVLSDRTRLIAEEMAQIVSEIATELDSLKGGLENGVDAFESTRDRSLRFLQFLDEEGGAEETRLHEMRNKMFEELQSVGDLIARVQTRSRNMAASLQGRSANSDSLSMVREELHQFSEELAPRLSHNQVESKVDTLAGRYTAVSERSAHERAMRELAGETNEMPDEASEEGSVELF